MVINGFEKGMVIIMDIIIRKVLVEEAYEYDVCHAECWYACNEGAIDFYLNYGFTLIGFDSCAYQNYELDRKEVRINLGIYLDNMENIQVEIQ